jgi:hypothetical protein
MYLFYNVKVTISNNKINSPVYYGIYAGSTDFYPLNISSNVISNVGSGNTSVGSGYYGMYLENHANVVNNTISGSTYAYAGIYLNNYNSPNQSEMQVTGNKISAFLYGVYSYYTTKLVASSNTISNIGDSVRIEILSAILQSVGVGSDAEVPIRINAAYMSFRLLLRVWVKST